MDQLDNAKELETLFRHKAIQHALRNNEPAQQTVNGKVLCIDCDEPIAQGRLNAKSNAARCAVCQKDHEQWEAQNRGKR